MTVRDAGLIQGWDLQGSPEDARNIYARIVHATNMPLCNSVAVDHVDMALFKYDAWDPPWPSDLDMAFATAAHKYLKEFLNECEMARKHKNYIQHQQRNERPRILEYYVWRRMGETRRLRRRERGRTLGDVDRWNMVPTKRRRQE